ncbi:MAG: hypothetical protein IPG09_00095 [Ignavibacteria bacterium]|nr:hypothetical protein [Ignavibacteria bacterium]MBK8383738.1 hypothetical protein [Ignavibacteria bacterium]
MKKGDVVLIQFPFTDLKGNKNRPAVVLLETENDVTPPLLVFQKVCRIKFRERLH